MNSINLHNITSIELESVHEQKTSNGDGYTVRHMNVIYKDYMGNSHSFVIAMFGDTIRNLVIRDETLAELDEAASEEAAHYAELEAGYKHDRI